MKSIYYSSLIFALLLGSCSQQKQITKTPKQQPSNIVANTLTDTAQVAATSKRDYGNVYTIDPRDYYEDAYEHIQQMLVGEQPLDFKKAVFVTENAWSEDKMSYNAYSDYIKYLANECKAWKNANHLIDYKWDADSAEVALNGALYHVMTDTVKDEKGNIISTPYHYDFNDCFAKDNWTNMFVTKLMITHGGNCHSLPFLYKILAEELGNEAYLCFLPGHIYINQYSRKISWYNTELTGRCFPVDAWLASSGYVSVASIRSGLYMDTLSLKQSIAVCVNDLAKGYERKFGDENYKFILKCCDLGLSYYPTYGELLLLKAETLKKLYQSKIAEYGLNAPDSKEHGGEVNSIYNKMEQVYSTLSKLDYREIPEPLYEHWTQAMINGGKSENENIHDTIVYSAVNGRKEATITISYGNFAINFNDDDTLTRIGSVMFNRITNKVEYFILKDDYNYGKELNRPEEPARFLSVDRASKKFPELSPYQYASDNPIRNIDIDGAEAVTPEDANEAAETTSGSEVEGYENPYEQFGRQQAESSLKTESKTQSDEELKQAEYYANHPAEYAKLLDEMQKESQKNTTQPNPTKTDKDNVNEKSKESADAANGSVPEKARKVSDFIDKHNGSPPQGLKGGRPFRNADRKTGEPVLPTKDANGKPIQYKEYDINPKEQGKGRDNERLVKGNGKTYYTNNHYAKGSFTEVKDPPKTNNNTKPTTGGN